MTVSKRFQKAADAVRGITASGGAKSAKNARNVKSSDRPAVALAEAIQMAKTNATAKFDETIDLVVRLGIDSTQSDQNVRGTVLLPHGSGKKVRLVVFAKGDKQKEAEAAGADIVGAEELVEKVQGGWCDFDLAIATPDMMKDVGKLGKVLGPRGLMPNPKSGTVTLDLTKAIKEFKAGKVEYRNDKSGNVHVPIGKASFGAEQLVENASAVLGAILRAKPAASKGTYMGNVVVSSTMGPAVRVETTALRELGR